MHLLCYNDTHNDFFKGLISTFSNFGDKRAQNGSKKLKNFVVNVNHKNYIFYFMFRTIKLLKSLQFNDQRLEQYRNQLMCVVVVFQPGFDRV